MSVFVDTSALYAWLVSTEDGHGEVAAVFRQLVAGGRRLATSNYVLVETSALLQRRFGLEAARDLERGLRPLLQVAWVTEAVHAHAVDRLFKTDRRGLSLVDCSSFVLMDMDGVDEALALDDGFAREGYRVLPRAG